MRSLTKTLITTTAIAAALAPAASADSLVAAAPGARHLTGAGGYLAWSSPTPDGQWRLTLRAADGTVFQPDVAPFAQAPRPAIGSVLDGTSKRLVAVYVRDGDVYELDLGTAAERRVPRLSTAAEETLVAVNYGRYVVARTGSRGGLFAYGRTGRALRLTSAVPSELAMAYSRVATVEGSGSARRVVIRRLSGRGRALVAGKGLVAPNSLWLTRYRAGWATSNPQVGTRLYATKRFAGSGGPFTLQVVRDAWTSPSALSGIAVERGNPAVYLDAEGVKSFAPQPFHGVG
jgi:hypothetical protein